MKTHSLFRRHVGGRALAFLVLVMMVGVSALGDVLYVDKNVVGGAHDGSTWADAFTNVTAGVAALLPGTEMWVAGDGIPYREKVELSITVSNVTIYGGFAGTETSPSERNLATNITTIDAENYASGRRCMLISAANVTVDGVRFYRGFGKDGKYGAGIYATGANYKILNCTFEQNRLQHGTRVRAMYGGGLYGTQNGVVSNCVFYNNNAAGNTWGSGRGGAIAHAGAGKTLTIANCIFDKNVARAGDADGGFGGALFVSTGTVLAQNCTFYGNEASYGTSAPYAPQPGGAIYVAGGTLSVMNALFWANVGSTDDIYVNGGTLNIGYSSANQIAGGGTINTGAGMASGDPRFADASGHDFHLESAEGRWTPGDVWVTDGFTSHGITLGNPSGDYSREPQPNGEKVNMGAYGGTEQASKEPAAEVISVTNRDATAVNTTARMRGEVLTGTATSMTLYYGLSEEGMTAGNWDTNVTLFGAFQLGATGSVTVTELSTNTTYHYRWTASNATDGVKWALSSDSFLTGDTPVGGGAGVIHVDSGATNGFNTGLDWPNAYQELSEGVADVVPGGVIWVADGTYRDVAPLTLASSNVTIYGGFDGVETSLSERDIAVNVTQVDGNLNHRCFIVTAANVTLDGLTIARGRIGSEPGAGIYNTGANLTVQNCIITNCCLTYNSVGCGIASTKPMRVLDSLLVDNRNTYDNAGAGGIYFSHASGTLEVRNTVFRGNYTLGINSGTAGHGCGGAIYLAGAASKLEAYQCLFDANWVAGLDLGMPKGFGAAIYHRGASGKLWVENCTFVRNDAPGRGGAIYSQAATNIVRNCILWDNTAGDVRGDDIYVDGGELVVEYACLAGIHSAYVYSTGPTPVLTEILTKDPLFVDLAGGDAHVQSLAGHWTATGWVKDTEQSPCIDAGDPASPYGDEPQENGARINLGAYGNTAQASKTAGPAGMLLLVR